MTKIFLALFMLIMPHLGYADQPVVTLEQISLDLNDTKSIERGAKFFANTCMSCHTLIYLRYDKLANDAGVVYEKMPVNVKWPEGSVPPDLSLEVNVRGANWLYTYLHSFYADPKRPTGVNNLLVLNTMMPGIIVPYQGQQALAVDLKQSETLNHVWQWYDLVTLQSKGSMSSPEFDATIMDVVNFLCYAAEPFHAEQVRLGWKVLLFLAIFFVVAYLLKREYWKDIKK
jgi:ubiquinol-cytochrome c reductase cytochrome c1 subunit